MIVDVPAEAALDTPALPPGPPRDAAGRARLAVAWATGFQLFRDVVQFGLTSTLVRLLPAEVYGQFGFVTTLLSFFTLYSFREFLGHTLQVRDGESVHYQDHFTAGLAVQLLVFTVVNGVAIGCRFVPAYAPVSPVLHVMAVLFLLDLPSEFRVKMLERELDWRRLRSLQAVGFVGGGMVSIGLAFAGAGVFALLLPTLLVSFTTYEGCQVNPDGLGDCKVWGETMGMSFHTAATAPQLIYTYTPIVVAGALVMGLLGWIVLRGTQQMKKS